MGFNPEQLLKKVPAPQIPWAREQYALRAASTISENATARATLISEEDAAKNKIRKEWWDTNWPASRQTVQHEDEGPALRADWDARRVALKAAISRERAECQARWDKAEADLEAAIRNERNEYRQRRDNARASGKSDKKEDYAEVNARWDKERALLYLPVQQAHAAKLKALQPEFEAKLIVIIDAINKEAYERYYAEEKAKGNRTMRDGRRGLPVPRKKNAERIPEEQPPLPTAKNKAIRNSFAKAVLAAGKPVEQTQTQVNLDQTVGKPKHSPT